MFVCLFVCLFVSLFLCVFVFLFVSKLRFANSININILYMVGRESYRGVSFSIFVARPSNRSDATVRKRDNFFSRLSTQLRVLLTKYRHETLKGLMGDG